MQVLEKNMKALQKMDKNDLWKSELSKYKSTKEDKIERIERDLKVVEEKVAQLVQSQKNQKAETV